MPRPLASAHPQQREQKGLALIIVLVILVMGTIALLVSSLNSSSLKIGRDQVTTDALAQAKEALIGFAVKVQLSSSNAPNQPRPGDLPCPDKHTPGTPLEGTSSTPCNGSVNALGRLPWKSLGLPDLRDSSGERLWYAISSNFKNSPRTPTLNSDTPGTISVFASDGTQLNDGGSSGSGSSGAIAVIIAPGEALQRQDGIQQNRSSVGANTASNYLDIATVGGNTEDNANFTDSSTINGFIQGRIKDNNENLIVNDQLIVLTQDNIMQAIQKRVAAEVKLCLNEYASIINNNGRYPWAVPLTDLISYNDLTGQFFGRIPANLSNTNTDSGANMDSKWGPLCNTHNINTPATWWLNWQEMVFYGLANAYKPVNPPTLPAVNACTPVAACLSVNPPSAATNKKYVVIVAGKILTAPPQLRSSNTDKATLGNYMEPPNNLGISPYAQGALSATFNDTVVFQ